MYQLERAGKINTKVVTKYMKLSKDVIEWTQGLCYVHVLCLTAKEYCQKLFSCDIKKGIVGSGQSQGFANSLQSGVIKCPSPSSQHYCTTSPPVTHKQKSNCKSCLNTHSPRRVPTWELPW